MTKYTSASRRGSRPEVKQVDPIWRGIGCLMILIIPVISFLLAGITVDALIAADFPVPYELMGRPVLPPTFFQPGLATIGALIQAQDNLYAVLVATVLYIMILGGLISVIYAFVYRFVGPPRYGPLDAPMPKMKVGRYKR